jgi:hypothetical protein
MPVLCVVKVKCIVNQGVDYPKSVLTSQISNYSEYFNMKIIS